MFAGSNIARVQGEVLSNPEYSHTVRDEDFYTFALGVKRKCGTVDTLCIIVSTGRCDIDTISQGKLLGVHGTLRSHNQFVEDRSRLSIFIFGNDVVPFDDACKDPNVVLLKGTICKKPVFRETPSGIRITDALLGVNRRYRKSDYIPCIAWRTLAEELSLLDVGAEMQIEGRLQSREYKKVLEDSTVTRIAYELSVSRMTVVTDEDKED